MTHLQRLKAILLHRELYREYLRTGNEKMLQRANGAITAFNSDMGRMLVDKAYFGSIAIRNDNN